MPTKTKNAERNKFVSNSEIHLDHCLCESRGFKIAKKQPPEVFSKKTVLENFTKLTEKDPKILILSSFLKKIFVEIIGVFNSESC